jgi:hypothetical protein
MSVKHSVVVPQQSHVLENQIQNLNIPQYHILILAWCALVVLYGETGLSPPSRTQRKMTAPSVAYF